MAQLNNLAILKLAPRIVYRMAAPKISRVNLSLTYKCNHRCVSCDIWRHQDESKEELTFSDVVNLSNKQSAVGIAYRRRAQFSARLQIDSRLLS